MVLQCRFLFSLPCTICISGITVDGAASLWLRKVLRTPCDGGCSLCDSRPSVMGHCHCGGGYVAGAGEPVLLAPSATFFSLMVTGPAGCLEASLLPLAGSARVGGARGGKFCGSSPCQQGLLILLYCLKLPSHLYWGLRGWAWGRELLFPGDHCSSPPYNPGVPMCGSSRHVCVTSGGSFVIVCEPKGRNKEDSCRSAIALTSSASSSLGLVFTDCPPPPFWVLFSSSSACPVICYWT